MTLNLLVIIFLFGLIVGILLAYYIMKARAKSWLKQWKVEEEKKIRKDVIERSRASLKGRIGEQLAPLLPAFSHEPSDARFIGSPVDYIIFEGLSSENPEEIIFADVKVGESARLTPIQKIFKKIVEDGKIRWETIHMDDSGEEWTY